MNKKSLGIFAILGASTMVASILSVNQPELNWSIFAGGTDEWHHYEASMPGEVEGLENGIREYWVKCGGSYQFTKPNSANIINFGTNYNYSEFTTDDDRFVYPVKLDTVSEVDMEAAQKTLSLGSFGTFDEVYGAYVAGEAPTQSKKRSSLNTQFNLGNDLSNLDVSEFNSNHSDDGEHTVNIYGLKDGKACFVEVPTIFVTSYITNTPESIRKMLTVVQTDVSGSSAIVGSTNDIYGYFKLTENLSNDNLQNAGRLEKYNAAWYKYKFFGTLDGNGKTISSQTCYPGGLFCNANNATFKNFTMNDVWCCNAAANYSLLASITDGCTFDNVSFNVSGPARYAIVDPSTKPGTKYGWISSERFINNTLTNCTFNTNTESVASLFSSVEYTNNTFTDCAFTGNKYCTIGGQKVGDEYQFVTTEAGLNINTSLALLSVSKDIVIYEDGVTKTTLDLSGTGFENASVKSIKLKNYDLGSDLSDLDVSGAIYDDSIRGNQEILVTVVDPKTNKPLTLSFNVNVSYVGVTKETISNGNQILDASLTSKQSLSLSGTAFANSTVKEIRIGGQVVGESLDNIVIPDSLRNDKTKHGETEVSIKLIKDGETKLIGFNIRLATRVMWNTVESAAAVIPYSANTTSTAMTGYYVLGEDVDMTAAGFTSLPLSGWKTGWYNTGKFGGTFDGNGHTIKWKSTYAGLFHLLEDATIKDLTINDVWYHGCTAQNSILAAQIKNTRLENLSINATVIPSTEPAAKTSAAELGDGIYGWISHSQFQNNTVVNCSFNTGKGEVCRLFCTNNGGDNTFTNCTFTTAGYYSLYKHHQLGDLFAYNGLTINGNALTSLSSQPIIMNEENQSISLSGTPFEQDSVNDIKLGNYSLGKNLSNLEISDSAMTDVSVRGNTYAVVNVTHAGLTVNVKVPLIVSVKIDAKTLDIDPLIIDLSSQTKSISLAGTDYQNDIVSDIALLDFNGSAEYSIGSNLSNLVIGNEIVNNKSLHGEYNALITLEHNAIPTKVMVPVILATKAIATFKDFSNTFQPTSFNDAAESFVEGYYVQTADISTTSNVNGKVIGQGSSPTINHGLRGIYNGLNHNITIGGAATVYNGGLFTSIYGGTLKNVKITGSPNSGSSGAALIGSVVANSVLDNVELKYTGFSSSAVLGVFGSFYFRNNKVSNIVVDATGLTIPSLFGRYYNGTSTFENVKVKANGINYVGDNNWTLSVLYNGSNLPTGVTFVSTAA